MKRLSILNLIMEDFISSYHIRYDEFQKIISTTNSVITGSGPLACYLKQNGIDPGFEPNNLDIFVETPYDIQGSIMSFLGQQDISKIFHFLIRAGYNAIDSDKSYESMHNVKFVIELLHPTNKKINIFVVRYHNLIDYIYSHFDLTGCMTWWNADTNTLETVYPEFTSKKEMHPCESYDPNDNMSEHYLLRVEKYKSRGFTFYERPPNYVLKMDDRSELLNPANNLHDKTAFDVIAYEDVSCVEYLRSSPWNILLQIGDKYHAYRRDVLYKTMMETEAILPKIGYVYDTPHHHTLTHAALKHILYADYSLYQLDFVYTISFGLNHDKTKSLYTLKCSDLSNYSNQMHNAIVYPPQQEEKEAEAEADDMPRLIDDDEDDPLLSEEEWIEYNQQLINNEIRYQINNEQ